MSFFSKFFGHKKNKEPAELPKSASPLQLQPTSPQVKGAGSAPGDLIANRYKIPKILTGGMGVVHLCLACQEDRPAALKTFKPNYLPNHVARNHFLREGVAWHDLEYQPHVHGQRGLKSKNILIGRDEMVRIANFGLGQTPVELNDVVSVEPADLETGAGLRPALAVLKPAKGKFNKKRRRSRQIIRYPDKIKMIGGSYEFF